MPTRKKKKKIEREREKKSLNSTDLKVGNVGRTIPAADRSIIRMLPKSESSTIRAFGNKFRAGDAEERRRRE